MPAAVELGTAYLTLAASTSEFGKQLGAAFKNAEGVSVASGRRMGKALSDGMNAGVDSKITDLQRQVTDNEEKLTAATERAATKRKQASATVETAIQRVKSAQDQASIAAQRVAGAEQKLDTARVNGAKAVEVAEKSLQELKEAGSAKGSQIAAAEQKVAQARAKAAQDVTNAEIGVQKAKSASVTASQKVATAEDGVVQARSRAKNISNEASNQVSMYAQAVEDSKKRLDEAKTSTDQASESTEKAKGAFSRMGDAIKNAIHGDFSGAFSSIKGDAASSAQGVQSEFEEASAQGSESIETGFSGVVGKLPAMIGALGLGAAISNGISESMEQARLGDKLAAQLDLTGPQSEAAGRVAGSLYAHAYGDSMESVDDAVGAVMSSIKGMSSASQGDLERVSGYALNLASAFDVDVTDAVGAVGILMNNGLAGDADQAFDLITGAMQKVPAGFRGEMTDAIKEYSKHFSGLGLSGEDAMTMLVKASEQGEIGIDKMGDAIKEFQIRSTDMSKSTQDAYKDLGLNAEDMTNKILAGGDSAKGAFGEIIAALGSVKDPAQQSQDTLALFGTQMEDLGVDKIPDMLNAMDPAGDTFDDFGGAAQRMGDTLNDNAATRVEEFKRTLSQGWVNAVGGMLEAFDKIKTALEPVINFLRDTVDVWGPFAAGLGIAAGAIAVVAGAVWAWTAAQAALDAALAPFSAVALAIIAGIGLMVGAVIWAWNNWEWFHDVVVGVWDGIVAAAQWAWETILQPIFQALSDFIMGVVVPAFMWLWQSVIVPAWNGIVAIISWAWTTIIQPMFQAISDFVMNILVPAFMWLWQSVIVPAWNGIVAVISWAWTTIIQPLFQAIWDFITNVLGPIFWWFYNTVIQPVWNIISWAIGAAWAIIQNIFQAIWWVITTQLGPIFHWLYDAVIKPVWDAIVAAIQWAWNGIIQPVWNAIKWFIENVLAPVFHWLYDAVVKPVWDAISAAIRWAWENVIKPAWDSIKWFIDNVLAPVFHSLWDNTIRPVWDWISDKISSVVNFIRDSVMKPLSDFIQGPFVKAWEATKDGIKTAWEALKDAVKTPIKAVVDTVVNPFIGGFNSINDAWNGTDIKKLDLGFASGGYTGPGRKYDPAGVVHADEFVIKKSSRRKFERTYPGYLDAINKTGDLPDKPQRINQPLRSDAAYAGTVPPHGPSGGIWGSMQAQASKSGKMVFKDTSILGASVREAAKAWQGRSALDIQVCGSGPGVSSFVPGAAGGWGFYSGNTIQVNPAAPADRRDGVLVHEIGHALGLAHTASYDSSSVMDHFMRGGDWPHSGDYQALREVWGQPGKGVKTYDDPGGGGGGGGGLLDWVGGLIRNFVKGKIDGALGNAKKAFPYEFGKIPIGLFQKMMDEVIDFATGGGDDEESGSVSGSKSAESWRGTVKDALKRVGLPTSDDYVGAWIRQIQTESGGNPNARQQIQDVNSGANAAAGLVQVIPGTFEAYRDKSLPNNRLDPLASLVAGMNYAKARYGTSGMLAAIGKGHGYSGGGLVTPALFDQGGMIHEGVQFIDHQRSTPDYVLTSDQWKAMYSIADHQSKGGNEYHMHMDTREGEDPTTMGRRASEAMAWNIERALVSA